MNNEIKENKPFPFWKFMFLMFVGLIVLTSIVVGVPYLLAK